MRLAMICAGLLASSFTTWAQEARPYIVKGTVNYWTNSAIGPLPDAGSRAFVLTEAELKNANTSSAQVYRYLLAGYNVALGNGKLEQAKQARDEGKRADRAAADERIARSRNDLNDYISSKKQLGDSLSIAFMGIHPPEDITWEAKRVLADANGVFTKRVRPGKYFVMVFSAHRPVVNKLEAWGRMDMKEIDVTQDDIELLFEYKPR